MSYQSGAAVGRTNGNAIASFVLGILGITGPLFLIGPILALVFGYMGRRQIDQSGGAEWGHGLAVAGIVLGWVGLGLTVLFVLLVSAMFVGGTSTSTQLHSVVIHGHVMHR
jgi:Domain of unknown function (DUF4190)